MTPCIYILIDLILYSVIQLRNSETKFMKKRILVVPAFIVLVWTILPSMLLCTPEIQRQGATLCEVRTEFNLSYI